MFNLYWYWLPNIGFGPFKFEEPINHYLQDKKLVVVDDIEPSLGWKNYKVLSEEIYIDVEDEKIVCFSSYEKFYYSSINLIGLQREELVEHLGRVPEEIGDGVVYDDGDVRVPMMFNSLGLIIWTSNEIAVLASCIKCDDVE